MSEPQLPQELLRDLECPVCQEIPKSTPIYQCDHGHLICKNCQPKLKHCPQCRTVLRNVRALSTEKIIAELVPFNCSFPGCEFVGKHIVKHELKCPFRPVPCIILGCKEKPQWAHLTDHLSTAHSVNRKTMPPKKEYRILVEGSKAFCTPFYPDQWIFGYVRYSSRGIDIGFYGYGCIDEFWLDVGQKRNGNFVPFLRSKVVLNEIGTEKLEKTACLHFDNKFKPQSLVFEVTKKMK